jgi:hypothetical protein
VCFNLTHPKLDTYMDVYDNHMLIFELYTYLKYMAPNQNDGLYNGLDWWMD